MKKKDIIENYIFSYNSIEIYYKGVLATDLPHGMKAGDILEWKGPSVFEFIDRKIIRITDKCLSSLNGKCTSIYSLSYEN